MAQDEEISVISLCGNLSLKEKIIDVWKISTVPIFIQVNVFDEPTRTRCS
jgi:hypothetical protein